VGKAISVTTRIATEISRKRDDAQQTQQEEYLQNPHERHDDMVSPMDDANLHLERKNFEFFKS
jgi:hypothetical protein